MNIDTGTLNMQVRPSDVQHARLVSMLYDTRNQRGPFFYPQSPYAMPSVRSLAGLRGLGSLGVDCTQYPGFVSMLPPMDCPANTSPYVMSMTNGCPVYQCLDNAWNYGPDGTPVFDPTSQFATAGAAQGIINAIKAGGTAQVAGASTPAEAVLILQSALANLPAGYVSLTPLVPSPTVVSTGTSPVQVWPPTTAPAAPVPASTPIQVVAPPAGASPPVNIPAPVLPVTPVSLPWSAAEAPQPTPPAGGASNQTSATSTTCWSLLGASDTSTCLGPVSQTTAIIGLVAAVVGLWFVMKGGL